MAESKIFELIRTGNIADMRDHIAAFPEEMQHTNEMGVRPVMFALYFRRPEMVQVLVGASSPLSLHEASALGDFETVRKIVSENPTVISSYSTDGFTALHLASFFGQETIAIYLIGQNADVNIIASNGTKLRPIHSAVAGKQYEIAQALVNAKADVNVQQQGGFTPLHSAVQNGDLDMVQLLLNHDADKTTKADDGRIAADFAVGETKSAMLALLR